MRVWIAALALILGTTFSAPPAPAHEIEAGDITIVHPRARPNLPNRPTAAYMAILNEGAEGDRLMAARAEAFEVIEMHRSMKHGDAMHMEPVEAIAVDADSIALLEPGGLHLMLFGAKERFKPGDEFRMVLSFEKAGDVEISVKVEKISGGAEHDHDDHSGHNHGSTTN